MGKKSRAKRTTSKPKPVQSVISQEPAALKQSAPSSLRGGTNSRVQSLESWTKHIRTDIVRILLLLVLVALLIGIFSVVDQKTTWLFSAGRDLSSFLRLQ